MEVAINPPARALGTTNAILTGRGTRYESRFTGPLSVKCVIEGRARWETDDGSFELVPGCALLLNDGEEYTIAFDGLQTVETFCFFFERGFVEDAFRATTSGSASLLDNDRAPSIVIREKLQFDTPLTSRMSLAHAQLRRGEPLGESFYDAALALVRAQADVAARVSRLPSLRAATREELARRIGNATEFLHANAERGVTIAEAARAAYLSPFHFHRLFTRFHGITPHRYLTRLRLERARALLRAGNDAVADVAVACGFESVGSFASLYKQTFGVTPAKSKNRETPRRGRALRCAHE